MDRGTDSIEQAILSILSNAKHQCLVIAEHTATSTCFSYRYTDRLVMPGKYYLARWMTSTIPKGGRKDSRSPSALVPSWKRTKS